ncbi:DUF262 domain-containing protein [Microbacterium hydrocarbonoxydans]|uniref:Uncharacterized conserved protein, contains ParB-like and HNH nuclease domains n=1 Tax=Microbacterium hydrocarbonoxydans TaxID=273678 RepID=A0A1H4IQ45_9MICO|nr:DUF262 domain-containing protein [Microbacterium hydrocarbonoxydans]SEB36093.1 Uncharacterized conserved protein, contains ParB-like and HNH nuclease domains [Microbacterium hydrocarbonoxydans]
MKIESEDIDIENLLAGRFFNIPRFQRPYSWDDENIQDLWDDVMGAKGEDYFIGSMVVYREGKQEFSVVDGQQRLTTITLLLCAMRDAFAVLGETDLAEGIHQLVERKNRSNKNEYVLRTETSFPYLQEKILKFGDPEISTLPELVEEQALKRAMKLLTEKVSSLVQAIDIDASITDDDKHGVKVDRLIKLRESVLNLKVIFVKLENEDDAYLIFETLNTRGKDLAVTDLVKNHFTKLLKSKGAVDSVKLKWGGILESIYESAADITSDAFLYHFWASRHESSPVKKLYSVVKKRVDAKNARSYLDALVRDVEFYRAIHEPSFMWTKNEKRVAASLRAIQVFRVVQPTPALLSLVRAYKDGKIKLAKLIEAVEAIERFHFTFTAITSSRSSGGISGMYSSFGRKLFEAEDSNQAGMEIKSFIQKLRERRPSVEEVTLGFRDVIFTNSTTKQKPLVRYILRKFAEQDEFKFAGDWDDLTIEHVAPQALIGTDSWSEANVGQLGNLFLLDPKKNGELANKSFAEKKNILSAGHYSVPRALAYTEVWNPDTVRSHTDAMAVMAHDVIWKI